MVQRDQWGTYWGAKKLIFLIREIDDPTRAAAPVEFCQFVVLRSPRGRLGWYNTCAIAYAAYAAASRVRYISHGPLRYTSIGHVNAVVVDAKGASAPPAPSGFCTQCGAPMASDARFCGSCGAAR